MRIADILRFGRVGTIAQRKAPRFREGAGTVVAIVGASGGCGKSTIASLLASLCARAGLVTLAIDADLQFGDMHRMLGVHEPVRMDEVVANPSLMTRLNEDAKSTGKPSSSRRPRVWNLLKKLLVSCLISSMPHGAITTLSWRALAHFGAKSMHVLSNQPIQLSSSWTLVPSLEATVHAVELCARMGLATSGFVYAVNKHERESLLSAVDASCALKGSTAIELSNGRRDVEELFGCGLRARIHRIEKIRLQTRL